MKLTLDSDMPVPAEHLKTFSNTAFKEVEINKLINITKHEEVYHSLVDLNKRVANIPNGELCWIIKWYLSAFKGEKSPEAVEVFKNLSQTNAFSKLQSEANAWRNDQQRGAGEVNAACAEALKILADDATGIIAYAKQLSALLAKAPAVPAPIQAERRLDFSRLDKLLGERKITQEEHERIIGRYGRLVENLPRPGVENIQTSPNPFEPSPQPTLQPATAATAIPIDKQPISLLIQDIKNFGEPMVVALAGLQDITGKMRDAAGPVGQLHESQRRLIKTAIKRRILTEVLKKEGKKEQLNEFLLLAGLIMAALGAVVGWALKKFAFPAGGTVWAGPGTSQPKVPTVNVTEAFKELAPASSAALGPNGDVTADNKPVPDPTKVKGMVVAILDECVPQYTRLATQAATIPAVVGIAPADLPAVDASIKNLQQAFSKWNDATTPIKFVVSKLKNNGI